MRDMLELLQALVRCPTVNHPPYGEEAAGQALLEADYREMGLEIRRLSPKDCKAYPDHPEFMPRSFEGRENLLGIWRGTGGGKSALLTGHMDVVPQEPLPWTVTEPFEPLIRDGRMYGRGTADMKAGLVIAREAVRRLREKGFAPKGDILLEAVVDEEYAGANGTIADRLEGYNADFAVLLEVTAMDVCPACVGGLVVRLRVKGIAGMPYTGEEIRNPAYDLAELIGLIGKLSEKRMREAPKPAIWYDTVQGAQVVISKVKAGEVVPHGQLSTPIDGWIEVILQSYPGETEDGLMRCLTDFMNEHYHAPDELEIEKVYHYCRPTATDENHPAVQLLAECARREKPDAKVCGAMLSCDMFALTEIGGIPSALFGPVGERLHAPDEWVDLESMERCVRALEDFLVRWCG